MISSNVYQAIKENWLTLQESFDRFGSQLCKFSYSFYIHAYIHMYIYCILTWHFSRDLVLAWSTWWPPRNPSMGFLISYWKNPKGLEVMQLNLMKFRQSAFLNCRKPMRFTRLLELIFKFSVWSCFICLYVWLICAGAVQVRCREAYCRYDHSCHWLHASSERDGLLWFPSLFIIFPIFLVCFNL